MTHTCLYKVDGQCTVAKPRRVCKMPLEKCVLELKAVRSHSCYPAPFGYSLVNRAALRRMVQAAGLHAAPPNFHGECVQALCDYIANRAAAIAAQRNRRARKQ